MVRYASSVCALLVAVFWVSGCRSSVEPHAETYRLERVNDSALPAAYPEMDFVEIIEGELTLHSDGRLEASTTLRCRQNLPEGSECEISGDGRSRFKGAYSRQDEWVELATSGLPPQRLSAAFTAGSVLITFSRPPSQGYSPPYTFAYREK